MGKFEKIVILDNEVQAQIMDAVLTDQEIPHVMKSYYDCGYDGIFQTQKGWGHIEAPEEYRYKILQIVKDLTQRE